MALPKVAMGKSVASVGSKAFYGCRRLAKVIGGAAVTGIGKQAYAGCPKLKSFTLDSKVPKTIGAQAFSSGKLLKTINVAKITKLAAVTSSLTGSMVTTVDAANSKNKAYKTIFKKAGKTVKVVWACLSWACHSWGRGFSPCGLGLLLLGFWSWHWLAIRRCVPHGLRPRCVSGCEGSVNDMLAFAYKSFIKRQSLNEFGQQYDGRAKMNAV